MVGRRTRRGDSSALAGDVVELMEAQAISASCSSNRFWIPAVSAVVLGREWGRPV